jgi:hypothetical protein
MTMVRSNYYALECTVDLNVPFSDGGVGLVLTKETSIAHTNTTSGARQCHPAATRSNHVLDDIAGEPGIVGARKP